MTTPASPSGSEHVRIPSPTAGGMLVSARCNVTGWSFKETTNAATAEIWLIDGSSSAGEPFVFVTLQPNQSIRDLAPGNGIRVRSNVFAFVVSGSVDGSVWFTRTP